MDVKDYLPEWSQAGLAKAQRPGVEAGAGLEGFWLLFDS